MDLRGDVVAESVVSLVPINCKRNRERARKIKDASASPFEPRRMQQSAGTSRERG